jgi:heat shock protein HtpX
MAPMTFQAMIADNNRKSALLVGSFILFTLVVASAVASAILMTVAPDLRDTEGLYYGAGIGAIVTAFSAVLMWLGYRFGDQMILAVSGAKQIQHTDDPQLFNVVEEMAIAAGVPMPKVYLMHDSAPNAFATGRDPAHGIVAITTGLRAKLNREELQGVIAHEMAHVRNYDIRLMLLVTVLVGTIVMLADFFWRMSFYGPRTSSRQNSSSRGRDDKGNVLYLVVIAVAVVLAILAPFFAQIIQLAISRQREYLADATAVQFTRNPMGLANALRKLDADKEPLEAANRGTAQLFIVNPIKSFANLSETMFSSHPPIKERIARLEALAGNR